MQLLRMHHEELDHVLLYVLYLLLYKLFLATRQDINFKAASLFKLLTLSTHIGCAWPLRRWPAGPPGQSLPHALGGYSSIHRSLVPRSTVVVWCSDWKGLSMYLLTPPCNDSMTVHTLAACMCDCIFHCMFGSLRLSQHWVPEGL